MPKLKLLYTPSGRAGEYAPQAYAANLYNGCEHGCVYCYAPLFLHRDRAEFLATATPVKDCLKRLQSDLDTLGPLPEPIFLCFTCDPYTPVEERYEVTRQAIELIHNSGNHVRILTKNGKLSPRDFDLLDSMDEFGVTLTAHDSLTCNLFEPGASSHMRRFQALIEAKTRGIKTWVSLEPVLRPCDAIWWIQELAHAVDVIKIGILNYRGTIPKELEGLLPKEPLWDQFALNIVSTARHLGIRHKIVLKQDLKKYIEGLE